MAAYDYDLGILGGGAAGLTAAAGSAQFGAKTILIEKASKLEGDCLHFGRVPSKTLIPSAGVWSLARRAKEFGLPEAALRLPRKADYTKVPWCTSTDPEVGSVGLNEKRAKAAGVEYRTLESAFRDVDRTLAEGEAEGKIKVLISPSGSLLGCQIAGHHAGELIHEWVAAINGGVKLSALAGAIHAYPTPAEISKKAAGPHYSEKLFGDRTGSILRFFFYKGRACTPEEEVSG